MSTNVSLANPGTSLHFDGRELQDQQEVEMEREEQQQQNELRQLLSNAFDDLDDDILSMGSSEDDSANVSHVSSVHDSAPSGTRIDAAHSNTSGITDATQSSHLTASTHPPHPWVAQQDSSKPVHPFSTMDFPKPTHWEGEGSTQWGEQAGGDDGGSQGPTQHRTAPGFPFSALGGQTPTSVQCSEAGGQRTSVDVGMYSGGAVPLSVGTGHYDSGSQQPSVAMVLYDSQRSTTLTNYNNSGSQPSSAGVGHYSDISNHPASTVPVQYPHAHSQSDLTPTSAAHLWDTNHFPADPEGHHLASSAPMVGWPASSTAYSPLHADVPRSSHPQAADYPDYLKAVGHSAGSTNTVYHDYLSAPSGARTQPVTSEFSAFPSAGAKGGETTNTVYQDYLCAPHVPSSQPVASAFNTYLSSDVKGGGPSNTVYTDYLYPPGVSSTQPGGSAVAAFLSTDAKSVEPTITVRSDYHSGTHNWPGVGSAAQDGAPTPSSLPQYPAGVRDGGEMGGGQDDGTASKGPALVAGDGGDGYEGYTVHYARKEQGRQLGSSSSAGGDLKVNFITQEGDTEDVSRHSQLQMLYQARGRQLEDLRAEMEKTTQESAKERRMLKHLLTMATGEKEGREQSLKQCQQLLQDVREEQSKTAGQLHNSELQLKAVTDSKEELVKKLQSAETTIENLTHQVAGLQGTDSLTQARQQHEAVINSLQQRFDTQLLDLKTQLDVANNTITEKTEEVSRLQEQVRQQTKAAEGAHISRGETINQLTRSLEESQQRCHALLQQSSSEESSKLRAQLQQSLLSKKMADDMCNNLQAEVKELKEQLNMLEAATSLGALTSTSNPSTFADDSIADLGIRKTLDFSSPECTTRFDGSQSSEELLSKLRQELERCVVSNRQKRQQLAELQQDVQRLRQDAAQSQQQLDEAQQTVQAQKVKLSSYEERLGGSLQPSAVEARLKRDISNIQKEREALLKDVEDYKARLNELSANEEHLTQINGQLKQQMAAMVTQHDLDTREALDRCRQSSEEVHKMARDKLEHQVRSELFADKQEVIMKYEEQLASTREEVGKLQEELDKVKDLYVQASHDLSQQEEVLRSKDKDVQDAVAAEKLKWEGERDAAMETVWQERLQKARVDWLAERQAETDKDWLRRLEIEQKKWEAEKRDMAERDWQERLETEQRKWETEKQADFEKDLKQRLETERQIWQSEMQADLDRNVQERLKTEREKWESERESDREMEWLERLEAEKPKWESQRIAALNAEWRNRMDRERKSWEHERRTSMETEWQDRLAKEKRSWQIQADREALDQADMAVERARRQWQQETGEELKTLTKELEECRSRQRGELQAMESKWRQEVETKEGEMEGRLRQALEKEVEVKLGQQRVALTEQAKSTLEKELAQLKKQHEEELQLRVKEEREKAAAAAASDAEKARSERQQQQQLQVDTQEKDRWREEVQHLQSQLTQQREAWHSERSKLLAEKDEERRQAVGRVRGECQGDYERLMQDGKATLDAALDSARKHHRQQLEEVEKRYKEELAALRAVEQELRQTVTAAAATSSPAATTQIQRPSQDSSKTETAERQKRDVEKLKKEAERLKREVQKRDDLLQQADSHMAQQLQQLQQSLAERYAKQLQAQLSQNPPQSDHTDRTDLQEELRAARDEQDRLAAELMSLQAEKGRLKGHLKGIQQERDALQSDLDEAQEERDRLDQDLKAIQEERDSLESNLEAIQDEREALGRGLKVVQDERGRLEEDLAAAHKEHDILHNDFQAMQEERDRISQDLKATQKERDRLQGEAEEREVSLQHLQQQQESIRRKAQQQVTSAQQEMERLSQRLQEALTALRALAQDKDSMAQQQQQQLAALQQSKARAQQLDVALKEVNAQHVQDVKRLQESLRSTHRQELAALNAKLSQTQKQHSAALEELQQQHKAEKAAVIEEMEKRHLAETKRIVEEVGEQTHRALANTPTQTDSDSSVLGMKDQYYLTVQSIKEEVMSHISQSNERAAETLKAEIRRERQRTIQHLRQRCKSRLRHLLQPHLQGSLSQTVWTHMDQALDSLFDSISSSHSNTPNTSDITTPRSSDEDTNRAPLEREEVKVTDNSASSTRYSTPQSNGSERYELPSALGNSDVYHSRSHSSMEDLSAQGVFYSLLPDDTASVTDSELDFKVPLPVKKTGSRRVAFQETRRRGRSTPPQAKTDLSVFIGKEGDRSTDTSLSPSLLSPKLHRKESEKEGVGWAAGGEEEEGGVWKEVKGEGWTSAVGGSNLWQAFNDLRSLELEEKEPRRQLRFSSQSFMDNFTDSDASFASSTADGPPAPQKQQRGQHGTDILSRSQDFTAKGRVRKGRSHSTSVENLLAVESMTAKPLIPSPKSTESLTLTPHRLDSSRSGKGKGEGRKVPSRLSSHHARSDSALVRPRHAHSADRDSNHPQAAHGDLPPGVSHPGSVSSKLMLNPKDFVSQALRKASPSGRSGSRQKSPAGGERGKNTQQTDSGLSAQGEGSTQGVRVESETLSSMLERLGIRSQPGGTSSQQTKPDPPREERRSNTVSPAPRLSTNPSSGHAGRPKMRTHSADEATQRQMAVRRSNPGPASLSVFTPHPSSHAPTQKTSHSRRRRQEEEKVLRSLEELSEHVPLAHPHSSLAPSDKAKSRSEQALHILSEAFGEGGNRGGFRYTPLQQLLPPPSPSTSLLSTYSVSEGDLRHLPSHLPPHLAFDGHTY